MLSAAEFEVALRRHVLEVWFPRCLDLTHGGYLCDFDRAWKAVGPHDKLLEFQGRHLCVAADACRRYPGESGLREATQHGFQFLRDVMWDHDGGGWFHRTDRAGRPLEAATKHAHGASYAIDGCVAVYEATGDPDALALAQNGFQWLDRHAHDREHGGWFGFLTRDGTVIREPTRSPLDLETDTIGTPIGLKDLNVHSDLLETFTRLYRVWPDPRLRECLAEALEILSRRFLVRSVGALHYFFTPAWQPVPHLVRAGYQFQAAYRLTLAPELTDSPAEMAGAALTLIDHILRYSRDPRGGFFYASVGTAPDHLEGSRLGSRKKVWWVQMEALKGLLLASRLAPDRERYRREFESHWAYIQANCLDPRDGGSFAQTLDTLPAAQRVFGLRFAPATAIRKGDMWKDARHDGRAFLYCMETLPSQPVRDELSGDGTRNPIPEQLKAT